MLAWIATNSPPPSPHSPSWPHEPTVERAQALGRALKAVPDLSAWIREQRQVTVRALLDMPQHSAKTLSGPWRSPQRVHDIAAYHRATANRRAAAAKTTID